MKRTRSYCIKVLSLLIIGIMLIPIISQFVANTSQAASGDKVEVGTTTVDSGAVISMLTDSTTTSLNQGDSIKLYLDITGEKVGTITLAFIYNSEEFGNISIKTKSGWNFSYENDVLMGTVTDYTTLTSPIEINLSVLKNMSTANFRMRGEVDLESDTYDVDFTATLPKAATTHQVTYNYSENGGTSATKITDTIAEGAAIDLTPTATRSGWTFVGWNTNKNATAKLNSLTMGTSDVTLYAIYKKTFTINYYDYNASATKVTTPVTTEPIYNKETSINITLPRRTYSYKDSYGNTWVRNGWTTSTSASATAGSAEGSSVSINSDKNYYMLYYRNINISYNLNGGTGTAPSTVSKTVYVNTNNITESGILGASVTIADGAQNPTKQGYTFAGWKVTNNTYINDSTIVQTGSNQTFKDSATLVAQWTPGPTTYKVNHYKQNGDGTYPATPTYTETKNGTTEAQTSAEAIASYADDGYTVPTTITQKTIAGDGSTVVNINYPAKSFNYTVKHYIQQSDDSYPTNPVTETKQGLLGKVITYETVSKESEYVGYEVDTTRTTTNTTITKDGLAHIDIYYKAKSVGYTVKHYKQQGNGSYSSTPTSTVPMTGTTGKATEAVAKTEYANDGYQVPTTITQKTIAGDGSTVVEIKYPANSYNYTVNTYLQNSDGTYPTTPTSETKQALLGATVTGASEAISNVGYDFDASASTSSVTIVKDGNPQINLYYKKIKYIVTFDVNGGNALSDSERTQIIEYGNSYGTLPTPTKTSSSFAGWFTAKTGGTQITGTETVTSSHTLYAHWDAKQYTVIFNVNGGDALLVNTKTVRYGETFGGTYTSMPVPERTGYTFEGWYTGIDGSGNTTGTRISDSTIVDDTYADSSDNINLYADWAAVTYTVTFDPNGGTLASAQDAQREVTYGGTYGTLPADPSKTGYSFDGWFKGETQITDTTPVTESHTVSAHWTPLKFTVTYKIKNDDSTETTLDTDTNVEYNTASTYGGATPTKTGDAQYSYTFSNSWEYADGTSATSDLASVKNNMTVYPVFTQTINQYTVTFKNYDGSVLGTSTVDYGGTASYTGETPVKPSTVGHTYTFNNKWMTALENGTEDDLTNVIADREVFASYDDEGAKYTVKFDVNANNNTNVTVTPQTIQVEYEKTFGDAGNMPEPSTYAGHSFAGWYTQATNGTKIENTTNLDDTLVGLADSTNSITLYAHWENAKYTVTFNISNAGNNSGVTVTPTSKQVTYGEAYDALPEPSNWLGHPFLGWFKEANGTTKVTNSTIVTETKNHILYAKWDTEKINVKFIGKQAQEGNEDAVEAVLGIAKVNYGENIVPSRLVDENGNSININDFKTTVVTPKYTYTVNEISAFRGDLTSAVTEERSIYINYNEPTINKYKIEFYDEDKVTYLGVSPEVDYGGTADDSSVTPQKAEDNSYTYTFSEWTDENDISDNLSNVIKDRKVYAKYAGTSKIYTVQFVDADGTEVSKVPDAHYGDNISVPADRDNYETDENKYTFIGWEDSEGNILTATDFASKTVTGNLVYTAKYETEKQKYAITFYYDMSRNQKLATSELVEYGNSATYNGNAPLKQADGAYTYTFVGWTDENGNDDTLGNVIANRDVFAKFETTAITYTIKYENLLAASNNQNPQSYTIDDEDIVLQNLENRPGLKFLAWCSDSDLTEEITRIETDRMENIIVYAKWDIKSLMYFVKESADIDNSDSRVKVYTDFEEAKSYVDDMYTNRNIKNLGIYDLNNDLVYHPEKIYYIKDSADISNENAIQCDDFEDAKEYVDELFAEGTTTKIYDKFNKLVYEPKEEIPQIKYFVKVNSDDENTEENTFNMFSDAKSKADELRTTGVKVFDINGEIVYTPEIEDDLYLETLKYKIGYNNVHKYEKNDAYLYRVDPNISLNQFKQKLDTNGNITVYAKNGEEISDNDIIKTGMTLKDERNGKTIILKISVKGDINGDGKVTATDLAAMNQQILKEINLTGESFLSADISDDNSTTATDLAAMNQAILRELDLSAIN